MLKICTKMDINCVPIPLGKTITPIVYFSDNKPLCPLTRFRGPIIHRPFHVSYSPRKLTPCLPSLAPSQCES